MNPRERVRRPLWLVIGGALIGLLVGQVAYFGLHGASTEGRDGVHVEGPTASPSLRTVATIRVGREPEGLALDAAGQRLYTANSGDNTVSVLNTATNTLVATIRVGLMPRAVALDTNSHTLYAVNTGSNTVSVIDTLTNAVTAAIRVGSTPYRAAVDSSRNLVYVSVHEPNVTVVDGKTRMVTRELPPKYAFDVALDSDGANLYASTPGTVAVVDTRTGTELRVITTTYQGQMAVDPGTRTLYLTDAEPAPGYFNAGASKGIVLTTIRADTPQTIEIALGRPERTNGIAFDPRDHDLYITTASGNVVAADPSAGKALATAAVGQSPQGPVLDTQRRILYVANLTDDTVSVVDYNT